MTLYFSPPLTSYFASRGFFLAWLLVFTKSLAWLSKSCQKESSARGVLASRFAREVQLYFPLSSLASRERNARPVLDAKLTLSVSQNDVATHNALLNTLTVRSIFPDIIKKALQDTFLLSGQAFCSDHQKCHRHRAASGVLTKAF